ncbi:MAG: hypothetical protein FD123_1543 [Bacteroidetes bacterium]|nr:MAG: hypothetical protein FD123_1543 [Bacteroidota bacterium]
MLSCAGDKENKTDTPVVNTPVTDTAKTPQAPVKLVVEAKTFEVKTDEGKPWGWGYDLYVDGKKTIHQNIIPAVQGNQPFATEQDARKVGDFAADKMMKTGEFPTISVEELQEMGIIKP